MHFDSLDPYQQDELALSEVKTALAQRGLDGPEVAVVSKKTIEHLSICYPELNDLEIRKPVWFVAEAMAMMGGTTDLSMLAKYLEGRTVSALDFYTMKVYMEIWSELYAIPLSEAHRRLRERSDARERAQQRHETSPQAEAKAAVKQCWASWQIERGRYRSNAAFARDMLTKHEGILTSSKVIEGWCTKWAREQKN
ncbi:hypothetical protein [Burkholderia gladioli]|uniref:hypothetical protein n=1 Tax=Burkholderia gladioli TaxID=28095 RepID=UPI001640EC05|nr:hypothetical protein [Burkholderia gladioli]